MKIYFGFTVAGNRSSIEAARRLIDVVSKIGHEVLTRHLVDDNAWEKDRMIPSRAVYLRDMCWLDQCDLFMAEVSGSSFGLGFETGYVLGATKKRVLLFYERRVENNISLLITGNAHPNCRLVPYSDIEEAEQWVQSELSQL